MQHLHLPSYLRDLAGDNLNSSTAGESLAIHALLADELDTFFWPSSRAGVMSAWWGHVPFAHWLVEATRPGVIVELGTHNGVSFAAFCEAAQRNKIAAKCFAVDTWEGDEHAGHYGEKVYSGLSQFIASRYAGFAELLRTTFDEAVPYFADGSIDLLHIDGLHTYHAVKRDFENWLPKLSSRAVVLFHDTNVREREFGVWQLWAELRKQYPGFEFTHAHGLGVLLVGPQAPTALKSLAESSSDDEKLHGLRERFAQLGLAFVETDTARRYIEHATELEKANGHLSNVVNEHQVIIDGLQATVSRQAQELVAKSADAEKVNAYIEHATELEKANGHLNRLAHERQGAVEELQRLHEVLSKQLTAAILDLDNVRQHAELAEEFKKANTQLNRTVGEQQEVIDELQRIYGKQTEQMALMKRRQAETDLHLEQTRDRFVEVEAMLVKSQAHVQALQREGAVNAEVLANNDLKSHGQTAIALESAQQECVKLKAQSEDWRNACERERASHEELKRQHQSQITQLSEQIKAAELVGRDLTDRLHASNLAYETFANDVYQSASWRLTRPMRALNVRGLFSNRVLGQSKSKVPRETRSEGSSPRSISELAISKLPDTDTESPAETEDIVAAQSLADVESVVSGNDVVLIKNSRLFDPDYYVANAKSLDGFDSPIAHYLAIGEAAGLAPSTEFDPVYYRRRYRDLAVLPAGELLIHYIRFGSSEGRVGQSALKDINLTRAGFDPDKPCMVVAAHEATRTGAAILSWNLAAEFSRKYNVVVLLRRGGPIQDTFADAACAVVVLPGETGVQAAELEILVERVIDVYQPLFVVANSVESRYFTPAFEQQGIPCVALVHEFSVSVRPLGVLCELFEKTSRIVFSAQIVADAALRDYATLAARAYSVLPQGPCKIPSGSDAPVTGLTHDGIPERLLNSHGDLASLDNEAFLVVGMGTITSRKGVEFFVAAADSVRRSAPDRKIVFAWIGKCYDFDAPYLQTLIEQVERSDLGKSFAFWGELGDLSLVYDRADALFLSSRLDPLPNVAIDAMLAGVPVVCFNQASGIADILDESSDTSRLVVPYLDAASAGDAILDLVEDPSLHADLRNAVRRLAEVHFNMTQYASNIEALALDAVAARQRVAAAKDFLLEARHFNAALYAGRTLHMRSKEEHVEHYLLASSLALPLSRPHTGYLVRRPLEGFHPLIYAGEADGYVESRDPDPLVHYLKSGRPAGRWSHPILRPPEPIEKLNGSSIKVAIHAHFHYPELFPDFIEKLRSNKTQADLYLTTTTEAKAEELRLILAEQKVTRAQVLLVANYGRDIGPMLCSLPSRFFSAYDIVGHFHGKRSPHVEEAIGGAWREFLWQHLIGDGHPMLDVIANAFALDPGLGLVFAEDPHLNDWDKNREHADRLAAEMGLDPLPTHLDFPQGTMFWARAAVLRPMLDLRLSPDDFPKEPLPIDGTFLHALERLLPFVAAHAGYSYAATYVEDHRR